MSNHTIVIAPSGTIHKATVRPSDVTTRHGEDMLNRHVNALCSQNTRSLSLVTRGIMNAIEHYKICKRCFPNQETALEEIRSAFVVKNTDESGLIDMLDAAVTDLIEREDSAIVEEVNFERNADGTIKVTNPSGKEKVVTIVPILFWQELYRHDTDLTERITHGQIMKANSYVQLHLDYEDLLAVVELVDKIIDSENEIFAYHTDAIAAAKLVRQRVQGYSAVDFGDDHDY